MLEVPTTILRRQVLHRQRPHANALLLVGRVEVARELLEEVEVHGLDLVDGPGCAESLLACYGVGVLVDAVDAGAHSATNPAICTPLIALIQSLSASIDTLHLYAVWKKVLG